jgi:hypothetical protein
MRIGLSAVLLTSTIVLCITTAAAQSIEASENQAPPAEVQTAPPARVQTAPPAEVQTAPLAEVQTAPLAEVQIAPPAMPSEPAPSTPAPEWIPDSVRWMGRNAYSRTELTLDHSMLVLASKVEQDNDELRRVIAGISAVSVRSYRFAQGTSFDPAAWDALVHQYREAGWQHLVSKRPTDGGASTDLWLKMEGGAIRNIAVMFTGVRQLHFVSVTGSIAPLDLLHLSGHFGIPKMDSGVVVPVPEAKLR